MSDRITSLIRTWVPIGIGAALTWLAATLGIGITEEAGLGLTAGAVALVTAAYYALARALESRWPWLGFLLGSPKQPAYAKRPHA